MGAIEIYSTEAAWVKCIFIIPADHIYLVAVVQRHLLSTHTQDV